MWTLLVITLLAVVPSFAFEYNYTTGKISEIHNAITQGKATCRQIIEGFLSRIEIYGYKNSTGAIIATNPAALAEASILDDYYRTNNKLKGPLHCAPLVAKDNIDVAGVATTNGLNAFKSQIPMKDATVVKNCRDQGAIFIAKANMSPLADKEAWGHSETGGLTRNPFALNYTTYGSSGGNSAAANAMLAIGGIGTETGVSINLPSSTGNIFGFRPPVDSLDECNCRDGVMPNSDFQDVVGPMARSVEDAVLIYDGMIGKPGEYSNTVLKTNGLQNMSINIFELMAYGEFPFLNQMYSVDPKIKSLFSDAVNNMTKGGATVKNVSLDLMAAAPYVFAMFAAEYTSCIPGWRDVYFNDTSRFGDGMFQSFDDVVASKLLPDLYQESWEKEQNNSRIPGQCEKETAAFRASVSALITNVIDVILAQADIVIWPTLPVFPAKLGQDAYDMDWGSSTTAPINLVLLAAWTGYPSVTVPLGFSDPTEDAPQGLPIGLHMMTTPAKVSMLLKAAYAFQENYGVSEFPTNFRYTPDIPVTTTTTTTSTTTTSGATSLSSILTLVLVFACCLLCNKQ